MNISAPRTRRNVLSCGAFDLSHPSEAAHLRKLRTFGDELILGCATDGLLHQYGMLCGADYTMRRRMLEQCRYVDHVFAHDSLGQIRSDIVNYNIGVFVMGEEWHGHFDTLEDITQVIYLPRQDRMNSPLSEVSSNQASLRLVG